LRPLDIFEKLGSALLAHSLQLEEVVELEGEDVGEVLDKTRFEKLVGERLAQAFDVHRAAAGKVSEEAEDLGRTGAVGAVAHRFAFRTGDRRITDGTDLRHLEDFFVAGPAAQNRSNYLGDHLACTLDDDGVADADVF